MMLRRFYTYFILMSVALFYGCSREDIIGGTEDGTGKLVINIDQPAEYSGTKAVLESPADKTIKTLSIWLVDGTNSIVATSFTSPNATSATVTFNTVPRGDHKLYIVANYTGLDSKTSGTIDNAFINKSLETITSGTAPTFAESAGIPSSLVKDVSISAGINSIDAHLIRAVGRFSITFRNMAPDKDLYIGTVMLTKKNQSMGYLFPKDDHSNPAGSEDLAFPDLGPTEVVKIAASSSFKVYDTYLYETTPTIAAPYKIQFSGGFVGAGDARPGYTNVNESTEASNNVGVNTNVIDNYSSTFMIRSRSSNRNYIGVNEEGTALIIKEFVDDTEIQNEVNIDRYLWTFDSNNRITSVASVAAGKKINMSNTGVSLDNSGRAFDINASDGSLTFTYTSSSGWWSSTTYYLAINGGADGFLVQTSDGNTSRWYLRKVTKTPAMSVQYKKFTGIDPVVDIYSSYPVNYLDKYGAPQPLQHICRNEHINLTVNVTHNSELGTFNFQVEDWIPKENETTFD